MADLMLFARQLDYKRWAIRHDVEDDEDLESFGPTAPDYHNLFGTNPTT